METPAPVRRWPWRCVALLLVLAGLAAAVATWCFWLPCRGTMLNGSFLVDYRYDESLFTRACFDRMDEGRPFPLGPGAGELGLAATGWSVVATVLLALVWLPLVLGSDWDDRTRRRAALPMIILLLTIPASLALPSSDVDPLLGFGLIALVDVSVLLAFVRVAVHEPETRLVPLLLPAWGSSAFGLVHLIAELALMVNLSEAMWDSPPGTGYPVAATLVVSGLTVALTSRRTRPQAASSMASAAVSASR